MLVKKRGHRKEERLRVLEEREVTRRGEEGKLRARNAFKQEPRPAGRERLEFALNDEGRATDPFQGPLGIVAWEIAERGGLRPSDVSSRIAVEVELQSGGARAIPEER